MIDMFILFSLSIISQFFKYWENDLNTFMFQNVFILVFQAV
jgi:hypothetical protein